MLKRLPIPLLIAALGLMVLPPVLLSLGPKAVKSLAEKLSGRTPAKRLDLPARLIVKADLEKPDVKALLSPEWMKGK